jgi:hypothetical protein
MPDSLALTNVVCMSLNLLKMVNRFTIRSVTVHQSKRQALRGKPTAFRRFEQAGLGNLPLVSSSAMLLLLKSDQPRTVFDQDHKISYVEE